MSDLLKQTEEITKIILEAKKKAQIETKEDKSKDFVSNNTDIEWPINCVVGPGLEGAIACTSKIGYVNGAKGWLIYRGYDIFDLCAYSTFEEVSYLLIHGKLPTKDELDIFNKKLINYRDINYTIKLLMGLNVEEMNTMAVLRIGTNFIRHDSTFIDSKYYKPDFNSHISSDEDSIPMETKPMGEKEAIYEFKKADYQEKSKIMEKELVDPIGYKSSYRLLSGVASVAGAVARLRQGKLPIEPNPELSFAANLIYMTTGKIPTPVEERIMDVSLILHADHGMNASTFATMVVASTLSDMYFAVGSGIAALNGPLHGGANAEVLKMLKEIGDIDNVEQWYEKKQQNKEKVMGFGHRVYKAYDPRARVLGPLAEYLIQNSDNKESKKIFKIAQKLEEQVIAHLGKEKKIFPNVDFYSGIVYSCLNIPVELFTPFFAVSRVSGWTARVIEYVQRNRIFRPRALYIGEFDKEYVPIDKR
ncbi:MAG: citrate/2-methylcitrate synthase [Candidatus Omnitrophica bacterium]|nr:citrate/2-methylcitrate synthase [Candidatus Omnitrophota bacterium]